MTGKEKCHLLRQIRREIAKANHIPYNPDDCNYPGDDCPGTCPKCDAEIRALDNLLNQKARRGEKITVSGISLDTYRQQVTPEEVDIWSFEDDTPTGIIDSWDDTPGIMMEVDPKLEMPVKDLNLPMLMRLWLSQEYIEKVEQLQNLVRYQPERLQSKNRSWYEAAVRELERLGLDARQPEPWIPVDLPEPDDIQGGMAPIEDDIEKWFSGDGDTIV